MKLKLFGIEIEKHDRDKRPSWRDVIKEIDKEKTEI